MAIADFAPADRSVQLLSAGGLRAIGRWVAARRARRARKIALQSLLFMPEHRLRDLGIRRDEVLVAIRSRQVIK